MIRSYSAASASRKVRLSAGHDPGRRSVRCSRSGAVRRCRRGRCVGCEHLGEPLAVGMLFLVVGSLRGCSFSNRRHEASASGSSLDAGLSPVARRRAGRAVAAVRRRSRWFGLDVEVGELFGLVPAGVDVRLRCRRRRWPMSDRPTGPSGARSVRTRADRVGSRSPTRPRRTNRADASRAQPDEQSGVVSHRPNAEARSLRRQLGPEVGPPAVDQPRGDGRLGRTECAAGAGDTSSANSVADVFRRRRPKHRRSIAGLWRDRGIDTELQRSTRTWSRNTASPSQTKRHTR